MLVPLFQGRSALVKGSRRIAGVVEGDSGNVGAATIGAKLVLAGLVQVKAGPLVTAQMTSRTLFPTSLRTDGLVAQKQGVTSTTESSLSSSTISLKPGTVDAGEIVLSLEGWSWWLECWVMAEDVGVLASQLVPL
jgi:hypothetical protein